MKLKTCSIATLLAIVVATTAYAGRFTNSPGNGVPDRYIVVLKEGVAAKAAGSPAPGMPSVAEVAKGLAAAHGGDVLETWEALVPSFVVRMREARARELARDRRVESVLQDFTISAPVQTCVDTTSRMLNGPWTGTSSPQPLTCSNPDPLQDTGSGEPKCKDNWGLDQIGDIRNDQLFHFPPNTQYRVHAFVLDSGIRDDHVEFTNRIGEGKNVMAPLTSDDPSPPSELGDCHGHGTHVAAILGGRTFGVAKNVMLHPVKVDFAIPAPGARCDDVAVSTYFENVARGLDWIARFVKAQRMANPSDPYPALVNWSGGNVGNIAKNVDSWAEKLRAENILLVQSAGNVEHAGGADACDHTVGREIPGVVIVAGTDYNQSRSVASVDYPGSNTSSFGSCVDIWAPAKDVISAWINANNGTCRQTGTSMAAPHVAGVAALYLQSNPTATPAEVERALRSRGTWNLLQSIGPDSDNVFLNVNTLSVGPDTAPVASFTVTCPGLQCTFDATASTDAAAYTWSFGDGTTGTGAIVQHNYAQTGDYKVVLEVRDTTTAGTGKTDHLQKPTGQLGTDAPPTASFTSSCSGLTCTFDSTASTDVSQRTWNFGDGTTATAAVVVTHTYAAEGTFNVVLKVTDAVNQTATDQKTIVLSCPKPVFSSVTSSTTITAGTSISLDAAATVSGASFQWYEGAVGDTSMPIGSGASVNVSPTFSSRYWVRATNGCGSTNSNAVNIGVTAATSFYTITPCRVMDSRGGAALAHDETRTFQVSGLCGIPAGTRAVAANVVAVAPITTGFLAFRPAGTNPTQTSTMNYRSGQTRANNAILSLSSSGQLTVYNNGATQHFIVDVNGYFK
jgi:serine protease